LVADRQRWHRPDKLPSAGHDGHLRERDGGHELRSSEPDHPADTNRRVDFNGRVISQLRDAVGNVTGPGGSVAFYAPGGIFISSTAVFDVGSLLVTSLDRFVMRAATSSARTAGSSCAALPAAPPL
jgi:hypothetical protein